MDRSAFRRRRRGCGAVVKAALRAGRGVRLRQDGGDVPRDARRWRRACGPSRGVEGVEPTNNAAERALRHAVIWRRISGGTDSEAGSRFVERMLTVVATCRQQGIGVLDYLTHCFQAGLSGEKPPSLCRRRRSSPDPDPTATGPGYWPTEVSRSLVLQPQVNACLRRTGRR